MALYDSLYNNCSHYLMLLLYQDYSQCFTCVNSLNSHKSAVRQVLVIMPILQRGRLRLSMLDTLPGSHSEQVAEA